MKKKCPENVNEIVQNLFFMSGKCPENVQNNNIQIPDIVYCPENVPKRDHFRHSEFVWNVSRNCPEFVQDLSKSGICPEN